MANRDKINAVNKFKKNKPQWDEGYSKDKKRYKKNKRQDNHKRDFLDKEDNSES